LNTEHKIKSDLLDSCWPLLWAKTDQDNKDRYHPLIGHLLDVAAVAGLVWDHHLGAELRLRLQRAFGVEDARTLVVFLTGTHDIGKASPGFQGKVPELCQYLKLPFRDNDQNRPHGFISAHVLETWFGPCAATALLGQIVGGHHGVFPRSMELKLGRDALGNNAWEKARHSLLHEFAKALDFNPNQATQLKAEITDPLIVPVLAGFVSVVDWVASNQDFFPCVAQRGKPMPIPIERYWADTQKRALKALETLGWLPEVAFAKETEFGKVFAEFSPNALQDSVIALTRDQTSPYLIIVEAPMGQGKTEAAFYAADLAMCRGFARGLYVAMPTQATGNAMFNRVLNDYLKHRGHQGKLNLQLVHGNALLAQLTEVQTGEMRHYEGGDIEAQSWFTAKKRPLLAPFGVGTIDQSLLSVLQTKHWFVRLFGLAGKVVIFDEVHAYDAYMSTILERLLRWLAEVDCTVMLLSATLPEERRKALAKAYSGREDVEYKRYPRVTLAHPRHDPSVQANEESVCREVPMGKPRPIHLNFAKTDLESLTAILEQRLEHGGCAAVVCNTVKRSIDIYRHFQEHLSKTECLLFHARTLQMWRREREKEVLRKFGKGDKQEDGTYVNPDRPQRAVLVATQVIEQSLDLDFDLMISEIAPVDLLLQRLGRLHRHLRTRPQGLETPEFIVLCDAERQGAPPESFGKSIEYVYERYVLLQTWLTLRDRDEINIPTQIESLVKAVYEPDQDLELRGWIKTLEKAKADMDFKRSESEKVAGKLLIFKPQDPSDIIEQFNDRLADDEDPEVHKTVRAATREGPPSITVVMLKEETILTSKPKIPEVRKLLDQSVKLSHRGVFHALLERGESPKEWSQNAHLRHARLLRFDKRDQAFVANHVLTVAEKLGVVIEKGEKNG